MIWEGGFTFVLNRACCFGEPLLSFFVVGAPAVGFDSANDACSTTFTLATADVEGEDEEYDDGVCLSDRFDSYDDAFPMTFSFANPKDDEEEDAGV